MSQEWPKWVGKDPDGKGGRIARDPEHARFILGHLGDCAVFATHPDADTTCMCGGVTPTADQLRDAGVPPKPLTAKQAAALDRIPDDGVTKAGGSVKGSKRRKK